MSKKLTILTVIICLFSFKGFSQEGPLKAFTEENEKAELPRFSKICLYPSTLRMVNISRNEDYNQLVNDVEKILIYTLDRNFREKTDLKTLFDQYKALGFVEYASVKGTKQDMVILGDDSDSNEVVGSFSSGNRGTILFYMRGQINWQKIPTLLKTLQGNDMVNIFDLAKLGPNDN